MSTTLAHGCQKKSSFFFNLTLWQWIFSPSSLLFPLPFQLSSLELINKVKKTWLTEWVRERERSREKKRARDSHSGIVKRGMGRLVSPGDYIFSQVGTHLFLIHAGLVHLKRLCLALLVMRENQIMTWRALLPFFSLWWKPWFSAFSGNFSHCLQVTETNANKVFYEDLVSLDQVLFAFSVNKHKTMWTEGHGAHR